MVEPLSFGLMSPAPATWPRSVWTTRCCCSTSSSAPPSNTPDAATLRGLERRFRRAAADPAPASGARSRGARQIGERLARQFEQLCHKPSGWMDIDHHSPTATAAAQAQTATQDDDRRFIIGLAARHPQDDPPSAASSDRQRAHQCPKPAQPRRRLAHPLGRLDLLVKCWAPARQQIHKTCALGTAHR